MEHMHPAHLVWWVAAIIALYFCWKRWRPVSHRWTFGRKYYIGLVIFATMVSALNGMRVWSADPSLAFWGTTLLGVMFMIIATVPCHLQFFNAPWYRRRLRDAFFIGLGIFTLIERFPDRWG